jgi:hypothetical protein
MTTWYQIIKGITYLDLVVIKLCTKINVRTNRQQIAINL